MECPRCKNHVLKQSDGKELTHVRDFFMKFFNPVSFVFNLGKGMFAVGRTIYYDFFSIKQTEDYWWCSICEHYFIECPHCHYLNDIGKDIMVSPKKIHCMKCGNEYVYATHPSADDGPLSERL